MDQKLLKALEDIGYGLEALVDALKDREESKSDTGKAIQSGDFGKNLESISEQLVSIKADTQEILKQQKTLLGISKQKEKETKDTKEVEQAGDPKKEKRLKTGIGTILLIAVAVLAIGMAFKLVGKIDFLSVISLGLAMYIVAESFAKVAALNLSLKQAFTTSTAMVLMSIAITLSSHILAKITPVGAIQLFTAAAIAGVFSLIGMSLKKIAQGVVAFDKFMSGRKVEKIVPIVLVAIATGITLSSWIMRQITPIGLDQALTAIFISLVFSVIGISLQKIAQAVVLVDKTMKASEAKKLFPTILVAIALAITASSWIMQMIVPIGFAQALTAIVISVIFMIIGYALPHIAASVALIDKKIGAKKAAMILPIILVAIALAITASSWIMSMINPIGWKEALTAFFISIIFFAVSLSLPLIAASVWTIDKTIGAKKAAMILPLVLVAISLAIMLSSHIFAEMADIGVGQMFKILLYGVIMAIVVTAFLPAVVISAIAAKVIGIGNLAVGVVAIVAVAAAIMASSLILNLGSYDTYPELGWILGTAVAIVTFSLAAAVLGLLVFGPQALIFAAGLVAVLAVAGTIVAVSQILKNGEYNIPGFLNWAIGTALLYAAFTPILLTLGAVGLASSVISFFGPNPWEMARGMMLEIAQTIVDVSHKLQEGSYKGGPSKKWAEGVAIALGAFAPVYKMLVDNAFWSVFGMGGIGPDEFASGITTVTTGIVVAANEFAKNDAVFKNGPPVAWATGVGKAIGAFSPVYGILLGQGRSYFDKIFGGPGPTVQDMKKAIISISYGIIEAAKIFGKNSSGFTEGKYPSKKWGEGVGAAIGAFAPVFSAISSTPWYSEPGETIKALGSGVTTISKAIVQSGKIFEKSKLKFDPNTVPNKEWGKGVAEAIKAFGYVFEYMSEESGLFTSGAEVVNNMSMAIKKISEVIAYAAKKFKGVDFKNYPTTTWAENVSDTSKEITKLSKLLIDTYGSGDYEVGWGITTMAKKMAQTAKYLYSGKKAFEYKVPKGFVPGLRKTILDFQSLVFEIIKNEEKQKSIGDKFLNTIGFGGASGSKDPIIIMANRMMKLAKGYDALANALIKLGGAMKSLNVKNAQELGNITAGILKGNSGTSTSFGNVTQKRAEIAEVKRYTKDEDKKREEKSKKPHELEKEIKQIIKILKNIDKSVSSVDDYISEMTSGEIQSSASGMFG